MVRRLLLLLVVPALGAGVSLAAAETPCTSIDAVLFTSSDLRITCTSDRLGRSALLLTNLDESGERLSPMPPAPPPPPYPEVRGPAAPTPPEPEPAERRDEPVEVVVRTSGPGEEGEVEVRREAGPGSTIVINIDNRQTAPPAPPAPMLAYGWGPGYYVGLPGPYQFPEHFHFLGTSHDNSYPKWFGGLAFGTSRYADLYKPPAKDCAGSACGSSR